METVSNAEDVASEIEAAAFRQATIEYLPIGLADDHETSDLLCQAVERQKGEEVVSVSAVAETRTLRRGAHDGRLIGAVLVAFAARLRIFRQMPANWVACRMAAFGIPSPKPDSLVSAHLTT